METGTISDIDLRDGLGLIDADDGRVVCFNRRNLERCSLDELRVGVRVEFSVEEKIEVPHVAVLRVTGAHRE